MSSCNLRGIVLGGTDVKEKDKLIRIFTLEKGIVLATLRGVRGDRAKLKSAKEIFCFAEFVVEEGKNYCLVTSANVIDNFYDISKNIEKYYEACAIIDIVDKIAVEPNPQLFIDLVKALKTICYEDIPKYYVIDKFLLNIFNSMGYKFLTNNCSSCGAKLGAKYFNLDIGEIVCPACKNALCVPISEPCYSGLKILNNCDYDKLVTVKLGGGGEIQVFNLLCKNYEWRTGYKVLNLI